MEKFIESFHCPKGEANARCKTCRDSKPEGHAFRTSLSQYMELPDNAIDFACPFGLPWDYVSSQQVAVVCTPHATWCERYGLPTSEHACTVCTEERITDPEFAQRMRTIGQFYGALDCQYRQDTGQTEEKRCCGGQLKSVSIHSCALTNSRSNCARCPNKS